MPLGQASRVGGRSAPGVLVTRPEPGAEETARRLAALGFRPVLAPALVLAPRPMALPAAQALLLTSRAAARALSPGGDGLPRSIPVLAVGQATAAEAATRGFVTVTAAAGDAEALVEAAAARFDPAAGPLLLAVGAGYGQALAQALRHRGFRVLRRIAYAARPAAELPEDAAAALAAGEVVAALFFSRRSAECAISLIRAGGLAATTPGMEALAISGPVAEAARAMLAPLAWRAVRIARRPDQDALLELLGTRVATS